MTDIAATTILNNPEQYTILVVDDNQTNLRVIVNYLREFGFKLLMAKDGVMGLDVAQSRTPDLILLDVMMPEMDGFETCQRLKANEATRHIPVIFMTALTSEDDKVKGFEVGAVDYITKPIQQREVLARVTTHLQLLHLLKEEQRQREIAVSLQQVSRILNSSLHQDKLLDTLMEQLGRVVKYDGAAIFLPEGYSLVLSRTMGFANQYIGHRQSMNGVDCLSTVFKTQTALIISNVLQAECWSIWSADDPIRSWMGAPLLMNQEVMGVLTVDSFATNNYTSTDLANLQVFANHAAVAIYNARLYSFAQQANAQLVKLNADKDKFFSIVAHDLKGPFLPLLGNLELMQEMATKLKLPTIENMSAASHRSARRVFELLENLLYWASLQMGRMEYSPQRLDLSEIAAKSVELLADNAMIKQIDLSNQVEPQTWVYADENMLDTVIRNLTNNALKFTPNGGQVTIAAQELGIRNYELGIKNEVTPNSQFPIPNYIEVSVADTGVGMSEETRQKLFKLDQHVTTIGTGKETGTGLGLIICQEMIIKSGGKIWVESEVGQGTTVKFTVQLDGVMNYTHKN